MGTLYLIDWANLLHRLLSQVKSRTPFCLAVICQDHARRASLVSRACWLLVCGRGPRWGATKYLGPLRSSSLDLLPAFVVAGEMPALREVSAPSVAASSFSLTAAEAPLAPLLAPGIAPEKANEAFMIIWEILGLS